MKTVLLCYSERNKVVRIPNKELEENGELAYLEMKFYEAFDVKSDPKQKVSFHLYSDEWKEYVELDKDDTIVDKARLKVLVTFPMQPQEKRYGFVPT